MESQEDKIHKLMRELGIQEKDLVEKFILGSGKGGQKVNKTSSCVYLKHIPTGIEIKCQKTRSRELNRSSARLMLCQEIKNRLLQKEKAQKQIFEKIRRHKRRGSKAGKEKMLKAKKERSHRKALRKRPELD